MEINDISKEEYYQSEQWKQLRLIVLQMNGFICQRCGNPGKQIGGFKVLQAHHLTYERFGCEDLEDLECVCVQCHQRIHKRRVTNEW